MNQKYVKKTTLKNRLRKKMDMPHISGFDPYPGRSPHAARKFFDYTHMHVVWANFFLRHWSQVYSAKRVLVYTSKNFSSDAEFNERMNLNS